MRSSQRKKYWVGFDLGGTKMQATVFNGDFDVLGMCRKKTKSYEGVKGGIAGIAEAITGAADEAGIKLSQINGIGIGCPGVLDLSKGAIIHAPNLGWRNVPLRDILSKKIGCPVTIVNDVDAGTFGEYRFGAVRGVRCVVGIFPGTGIGGSCVYEGKLLRGAMSSCMEIGHLQVIPDGPLCGCGRRGCLEAVASRVAISAEAASAAYRGMAPILLELAGTDLASIRSKTLAEAIREGDVVVEKIVRHAAAYLGAAITSVVNLLAPDVVVLGGGLVEAMPMIFIQETRDAIRRDAMASFRNSVKVVEAKLGDDAGVMGAAALAAESAK